MPTSIITIDQVLTWSLIQQLKMSSPRGFRTSTSSSAGSRSWERLEDMFPVILLFLSRVYLSTRQYNTMPVAEKAAPIGINSAYRKVNHTVLIISAYLLPTLQGGYSISLLACSCVMFYDLKQSFLLTQQIMQQGLMIITTGLKQALKMNMNVSQDISPIVPVKLWNTMASTMRVSRAVVKNIEKAYLRAKENSKLENSQCFSHLSVMKCRIGASTNLLKMLIKLVTNSEIVTAILMLLSCQLCCQTRCDLQLIRQKHPTVVTDKIRIVNSQPTMMVMIRFLQEIWQFYQMIQRGSLAYLTLMGMTSGSYSGQFSLMVQSLSSFSSARYQMAASLSSCLLNTTMAWPVKQVRSSPFILAESSYIRCSRQEMSEFTRVKRLLSPFLRHFNFSLISFSRSLQSSQNSDRSQKSSTSLMSWQISTSTFSLQMSCLVVTLDFLKMLFSLPMLSEYPWGIPQIWIEQSEIVQFLQSRMLDITFWTSRKYRSSRSCPVNPQILRTIRWVMAAVCLWTNESWFTMLLQQCGSPSQQSSPMFIKAERMELSNRSRTSMIMENLTVLQNSGNPSPRKNSSLSTSKQLMGILSTQEQQQGQRRNLWPCDSMGTSLPGLVALMWPVAMSQLGGIWCRLYFFILDSEISDGIQIAVEQLRIYLECCIFQSSQGISWKRFTNYTKLVTYYGHTRATNTNARFINSIRCKSGFRLDVLQQEILRDNHPREQYNQQFRKAPIHDIRQIRPILIQSQYSTSRLFCLQLLLLSKTDPKASSTLFSCMSNDFGYTF